MGRLAAVVLGILAIGAIAAVVWAAGRPASMDASAVDREADSVASMLAEGSVLAGIVADGDGYDRATTVRATEIADALESSATTLERTDVPRSRARQADTSVRAATYGASLLAHLVTDPGNRDDAAELADQLDLLSKQAAP